MSYVKKTRKKYFMQSDYFYQFSCDMKKKVNISPNKLSFF